MYRLRYIASESETDGQTTDKVIPMCRCASHATQKGRPSVRLAETFSTSLQLLNGIPLHSECMRCHMQRYFSCICDGTYAGGLKKED